MAKGFRPVGIADWTHADGADAGIYMIEGAHGSAMAFRVEIHPAPSAGHAGHQAAEASDDLTGMAWWNRLSDKDRKHGMREAGDTGRAVDAWRTFKRA